MELRVLFHFPLPSCSPLVLSLCYYGVCLPLPLCFKHGETALMLASANGDTATVELLLGAGADKEAKEMVSERMRESESHTHLHMVDKMV